MERGRNLEVDLLDEIDISSYTVGNTAVKTKDGMTIQPNVTPRMSFFSENNLLFRKYRRYYVDAEIEPVEKGKSAV